MPSVSPYYLKIEIPDLPIMPNQMLRDSNKWMKINEKKKWLSHVTVATIGKIPKRMVKKARIHCIRYSSRMPDFDGLVGSFKIPIDCLVKLKILEDDSMKHIGVPKFEWFKVPQKKGKIEIELYEL